MKKIVKKKSFRSDIRAPRRKKFCFFCAKKLTVDYKDVEHLRDYITRSGKILPRRITGLCAKHQRALTRAVKQARIMALLPFTKTH